MGIAVSVLGGCRSRGTGSDSGVKRAGFEQSPAELTNSIGVIASDQNANFKDKKGSASIIGETSDTWIGVTAFHVWESACKPSCVFRLPADKDFKDWSDFAATSLLWPLQDKTEHIASPTKEFDYAFFEIKKTKDNENRIKPLPITFAALPNHASVKIFGYPTKVYAASDKDQQFGPILVTSKGISSEKSASTTAHERDNGEKFSRQFALNGRPGNSGGAIGITSNNQFILVAVVQRADHFKVPTPMTSSDPKAIVENIDLETHTFGTTFATLKKQETRWATFWQKLEQSPQAVASPNFQIAKNMRHCFLGMLVETPVELKPGITPVKRTVKMPITCKTVTPDHLYYGGLPVTALPDYQFNETTNIVTFSTSSEKVGEIGTKFSDTDYLLEYESPDGETYATHCHVFDRGADQAKRNLELFNDLVIKEQCKIDFSCVSPPSLAFLFRTYRQNPENPELQHRYYSCAY